MPVLSVQITEAEPSVSTDDLSPGHALDPDRQHKRQDGRQSLGDGRHRQRYPQQQHFLDIGPTANLAHQQHRTNHQQGNQQHGPTEHDADLAYFLLERRRLLRRLRKQMGDTAHLGGHPAGRHQRHARALNHRGALEHHVGPFGQRGVPWQYGSVLEHCVAFTGERRLLHPQRMRLQQARVCAHAVAFGQLQQITRHQFDARHPKWHTVAQHGRGDRAQTGQGSCGALGADFLEKPQQGIEQNDDQDDQGIDRPSARAFRQPDQQCDADGRQQQIDQGISELRQQMPPCRYRRFKLQRIRTKAIEAPTCLFCAQPTHDVGVEAFSQCGCLLMPRLLEQPGVVSDWWL